MTPLKHKDIDQAIDGVVERTVDLEITVRGSHHNTAFRVELRRHALGHVLTFGFTLHGGLDMEGRALPSVIVNQLAEHARWALNDEILATIARREALAEAIPPAYRDHPDLILHTL